jgi:hypothetical protein
MTTIAVDTDGTVAADTQLTGGNYVLRVQKVVRLPDGGVAAAAGLWTACYVGLKWLADGAAGEPPDIDGAQIVVVKPDRSIWLAENTFPAYPILDRALALGCGQDLARQALADGMNAIEAVAKACELDAKSSDPVQWLQVEPTHEYTPVETLVKEAPRGRRRARRA